MSFSSLRLTTFGKLLQLNRKLLLTSNFCGCCLQCNYEIVVLSQSILLFPQLQLVTWKSIFCLSQRCHLYADDSNTFTSLISVCVSLCVCVCVCVCVRACVIACVRVCVRTHITIEDRTREDTYIRTDVSVPYSAQCSDKKGFPHQMRRSQVLPGFPHSSAGAYVCG